MTTPLIARLTEMQEQGRKATHEERCGANSLLALYRHGGAASDAVVRWCQRCGAVVIDEDYDGRLNPGAYMQMTFPHGPARNALPALVKFALTVAEWKTCAVCGGSGEGSDGPYKFNCDSCAPIRQAIAQLEKELGASEREPAGRPK